jgi:tetratricopeptide (TPR) repeat protein
MTFVRHTVFPHRSLASNNHTTVKIDKSSSNNKKPKKKKRGDKSKSAAAQQSPDVAKEREIQDQQQKVRFYHQQGAFDEALQASNELLDMTESHFGKDHPVTASAYNNVGLMHKLLGNYKEAQQHYHQALRSYGFILGKDHASYAAALHNLGTLLKTQVTLDEELTAMERLSLTEEAIQHLEESYNIRKVELGEEHPHTVASQSALGSTIASQILALQAQQQQQQSDTTIQQDGNESNEWKPSKMTQKRMEMAEQYLKQALETATANPRGNRLQDEHAKNAYKNITTLSAAAAAQNLAVILKTRATLSSPTTNEEMLLEAKQLYEQALVVRTSLLHEAHPDTVATKFSLAELVAVIGDEEGANQLRQEIMDAYNITEVDDEEEE